MATQLPKLLGAVFAERQQIKTWVKQQQVDAIISDNRFGCIHPNIKSVFITHQLHIRIPNPILSPIIEWINRKFIGQFNECWVPDHDAPDNLAGVLSFPPIHPNTKYLGTLSRMKPLDSKCDYDLIAILSGPEPQRTNLENILLHQLAALPLKSLLIQGKTEKRQKWQAQENVEIVSFLTTKALNHAIASSKYVICRSGYSSIMDLIALGKKALLIPTPGQTEQEYLADHFFEKGYFYKQEQNEVDIEKALNHIKQWTPLNFNTGNQLQNTITNFLSHL